MKQNLDRQRVFLTLQGAQQLFCNPAVVGLPVVPTFPCDVNGTYVYGDTFAIHCGHYIGGCIGEQAFTTEPPTSEQIASAILAYDDHIDMLNEQFGYEERLSEDVLEIMALPQGDSVPTLDEIGETLHELCPIN